LGSRERTIGALEADVARKIERRAVGRNMVEQATKEWMPRGRPIAPIFPETDREATEWI
jgi:head-tail adaptor